MALIDHTYFAGEQNIPNADRTDMSERIQWLILKHEPALLRDVLGVEMYDDLQANPGNYAGLLNGEAYTNARGTKRYWPGLKSSSGLYKQSLIASYVYYYWLRDSATNTTGVGEVKAESENSVRVSSVPKQVRAWNEAVRGIEELMCYLEANKATYTLWDASRVRSLSSKYSPINLLGI